MGTVPANSIADLRDLARARLPRALFDYIDRGSYDERTWARNRDDLRALTLRQRVLVDVSRLSLATTVLGEPWSMPVGIAPTGLTGLFWRDGEIAAARAARAAGVPFCLSTMSICSLEDVRGSVDGPFWFQLYLMRDRGFTDALIARARAAGCPALVLTLDLPMQALRRRDAKNGLAVPPRLDLQTLAQMLSHPRWLLGTLRGRRRTFGNLASFFPEQGAATLAEWSNAQLDSTLSWKDIAWVRERWPGKLILKGILDADDASAACAHGVDALIVSNHGGRQLDGTTSTIAALPAIVDAVANRCEVLLDGGITCGQDVLKALALGARAVFLGKAYLYGLAAAGEPGVALALALIRAELGISMALCGERDVRHVGRQVLAS
ncbi:MAG TPA: alpha-hydroxy acid oxidase [Steroidobacteraceae bacterium]|nr:alpha-hydroxy acid oxidase [Steroidobacteraceae bacterium]